MIFQKITAKKKSSRRWLQEHFNDPYVKKAKQDGYRSRASYKLLEIQEKDNLIKPGMRVLELGAAPGGWSQVVLKLLGKNGKLFALDLLPMETLAGLTFIQGDFCDEQVMQQLMDALGSEPVDLVISDMAPNTSGISIADQLRSTHLAELVLDLAQKVLKPEGALLTKVFQGLGFMELRQSMLSSFKKVVTRKPPSSRARSREAYLLARGYTKQETSDKGQGARSREQELG